jgi:hypothetical protein
MHRLQCALRGQAASTPQLPLIRHLTHITPMIVTILVFSSIEASISIVPSAVCVQPPTPTPTPAPTASNSDLLVTPSAASRWLRQLWVDDERLSL